jgi:hypothetical protein
MIWESNRSATSEPTESEVEGMSGEIARTYELLFKPRQVVELRAFKERETLSGYFDDGKALTREASKLDRRGYSVYVTLNEINPALLARAMNRTRKVYKEPTTSDSDVGRRRWLPLDFDPGRPSGVSATDTEKEAARRRVLEVRKYLRRRGWPEPILADSGNGYHLLYAVDLPNDTESLDLIKGILEAISFRFSDKAVEVDTTTRNAARIWKLYGTTAHKGDDVPVRPHRPSKVLEVPGTLPTVNREELGAVSMMRPTPPPRRPDPQRDNCGDFDLDTWIGEHEVAVKREGPWERGGYRWILEECPWNGHRDNSAYIVQFGSGTVAAGCHHDSCRGYGWRELRKYYEPSAYEQRRYEATEAKERAGPVPATPGAHERCCPAHDQQPGVRQEGGKALDAAQVGKCPARGAPGSDQDGGRRCLGRTERSAAQSSTPASPPTNKPEAATPWRSSWKR